jgi:uncharacterized membrane protein HdeD (DUF308 family)
VELSEKELEMISGGGFVDWFKKSWKQITIGAVLLVAGASAVAAGIVSCNPAAVIIGTAAAVAGVGTIISSMDTGKKN